MCAQYRPLANYPLTNPTLKARQRIGSELHEPPIQVNDYAALWITSPVRGRPTSIICNGRSIAVLLADVLGNTITSLSIFPRMRESAKGFLNFRGELKTLERCPF